jgi:hypothetical protein
MTFQSGQGNSVSLLRQIEPLINTVYTREKGKLIIDDPAHERKKVGDLLEKIRERLAS